MNYFDDMKLESKPTALDIKEAAKRIQPFAHRTPILTSQSLDQFTGNRIFFKCENFQKVGAFKFRGAINAVYSLSDKDASRGVATHSSGNHAQALSLAAKKRGIKSYIVMPDNATSVKIEAVKGYGGEITFCKPTLQAREQTLEEIVKNTGAVLIHPYNDLRIIAGQSTAALELLEEIKDLDLLMAPVGGGGLLSGTALAAFYFSSGIKVIGAEPEAADDAFRSLNSGEIVPSVNPKTIADGLLSSLGTLTFPIIREYVSEIITVSEDNIIKAMRLFWERMKIIVEPSGAVPLGALLQHRNRFAGKRIGIIISGGNVDIDKPPWMSIS